MPARDQALLDCPSLASSKALQSIGFCWLCKRVSCAKTDGPILTICALYVLLPKELPFGSRDDCACVKIFTGVFLKSQLIH